MAQNNESYSSENTTGNSGPSSLREEVTPFESSPSDAPAETKPKSITVEEFDRMFDDGEDISDYIDWSSVRRPGLEPQDVVVDFPNWMVCRLDREAERRGVSREALIKLWIADRLESIPAK